MRTASARCSIHELGARGSGDNSLTMDTPVSAELAASHAAAHMNGLAETAHAVGQGMSADIARLAVLVAETLSAGGKLMFCGNGGSAADAQHLATEYVVRFRRTRRALPAIALTTDTSLLTAAANDLGFEQVFARQVSALGQPGDLLFLHTTSGESPNLLAAADAARERGVVTVGMLGTAGGPLRSRVDHALLVPARTGAHAQELHLAIGHVICDIVEHSLERESTRGQ
jgi:D-sedoheptulose 7-phosphate isomerase